MWPERYLANGAFPSIAVVSNTIFFLSHRALFRAYDLAHLHRTADTLYIVQYFIWKKKTQTESAMDAFEADGLEYWWIDAQK